MSGPTPRCCGCINILTGTTILVVLYLIGGGFNIISGAVKLTGMNNYDNQYMHTYSNSSTTNWITLTNGLLLVLLASLALHGLRVLFGIFCYVIVIGAICIYWAKVYQYLALYISEMSEDVQESFDSISPSALEAIVVGTLAFIVLINIYFATVVYRCYKHILIQALTPQPISTLAWNQASVETGIHIYNHTPPHYNDVQKIPLVNDMEPVDEQKPPVYAA